MKPFNLEEYLKNPKRKIITGDDRTVSRVLCTNAMGLYPFVVLLKRDNSPCEQAISYTKDGKYIAGDSCDYDLFFATEKHKGWVNVYRNEEHLWCGDIKRTEAEAKEFEDSEFYITSIKIEWEE